MRDFKVDAFKTYFAQRFGRQVEVLNVTQLGTDSGSSEQVLKGYGYGTPLLIELQMNGSKGRFVLSTVRLGGFGHERMADRASILLWEHEAFNLLPKHVKAVDVGSFTKDGSLKSLGDCEELFLVREWVDGREYYRDLDRIRMDGFATDLDFRRVKALADYLAEIHAVKHDAPELYVRRIRDLVGQGECLMGLLDSYPSNLGYIGPRDLLALEKRSIEWRWRIKSRSHRLSQVHGDFHPWNLLFREGIDFTALDRSRGEWGEPADDVSCMTANYLFYALQQAGHFRGPFQRLWKAFFDRYLERTGDNELFEVIQPFYTWRALVIASPIWYPNLELSVRMNLLNFARNVLEIERFDPDDIDGLLEPRR